MALRTFDRGAPRQLEPWPPSGVIGARYPLAMASAEAVAGLALEGPTDIAAIVAENRDEAAQHLLSALGTWWRRSVRSAGVDEGWEDLATAIAARPPLEPLPIDITTMPLRVDGDGYDLGEAYVALLDPRQRSEHGRHYTPRRLAERLWVMAREERGAAVDGLVRDPACGAGALLIMPVRDYLERHAAADAAMTLASIPQAIEGIDTDPWAVYVANVVLAAEMLPTLARTSTWARPLPALARVGDGLTADLGPAAVWIMNPPYGRRQMTEAERDHLGHTVHGHANMYGLFLAAATERLTDDGVIAALVPTSFTAGLYFSKLRRHLTDAAPMRRIAFVRNRSNVFRDVQQETCLAVFAAARPAGVAVESIGAEADAIGSFSAPTSDGPWILPRRHLDADLAARAAALPLTLRAAGWHASTGPLVWNRRRSDLRSRAGKNRVRVVWAADIDGGALHRDPARNSFRYLILHDERDRITNTLTEPAVLVQRTTAPEQHRRLVVSPVTQAELDAHGGSVIVENHVNVLRNASGPSLMSHDLLARLLSTNTVDRVMRCISGSTAVSSYELGALPLPDPDMLTYLGSVGPNDFEAAVAKAYGVPLAF